MLTPELHDAAQAFGRALRQTPAVAAYRAATDALADDVDAQRILMALRGPQASYVRTQQAGAAPEPGTDRPTATQPGKGPGQRGPHEPPTGHKRREGIPAHSGQ